MDPHRPDTVYKFPLLVDGERVPFDWRRVSRSIDAGKTWTPSAASLLEVLSARVVV